MACFIVSIQISERQKLFLRQHGEDFVLTPERTKATPFPEAQADRLAAAHALYAAIPAEVEGVKGEAA
jgi:hypothetical protein